MPVIKRDNYEEFFISYLDGTLTKKEVEELLSFLKANPDLKEELTELENSFLMPENIGYAGKNSLKKQSLLSSSASDNFNELCIARVENDLTQKEKFEFDLMIKSNLDLKNNTYYLKKLFLVLI